MNFRERIHWIFRMLVLAFILASVAFLSALTAMRLAIRGREVTMPDLAGMPATQAKQILQGRGVGMTVEDRIYSHYPVDSVVRQSPLPDMHLKVGQNAHVVLSLGQQQVSIPQLEQINVRAAQVELLRDGLQLGEVSSTYLPQTEADTVLQQDPAPGMTNASSAHVDLLVSLGPRPTAYVMPMLVGKAAGEAEAKLARAGLKVAKLTPVEVPGAEHGNVLEQSPAAGQRVDAGTTIELEVAQ